MAQYKLTYFNGRGRAEVSRLILAAAAVDYEDIRVEHSRFADIKPSLPFGQIPILEVDGVTLCQSKAIARFLAVRCGLAGKTELERAQADMIVDCIDDMLKPTMLLFHEKDTAKQLEMKTKYEGETLPSNLASLQKLLESNHGGDGFFVGDSFTWCDLAFTDLCTWLAAIDVTIPLDNYPKLKALKDRVEGLPKVAEWIKKRPVTLM